MFAIILKYLLRVFYKEIQWDHWKSKSKNKKFLINAPEFITNGVGINNNFFVCLSVNIFLPATLSNG